MWSLYTKTVDFSDFSHFDPHYTVLLFAGVFVTSDVPHNLEGFTHSSCSCSDVKIIDFLFFSYLQFTLMMRVRAG